MIRKGQEIKSNELTNIFTETIRDINELTFDRLKSLSTGCFTGSSPTYGELLNIDCNQFLLYSTTYVQEFLDAIDEIKSR